MRYKFWFITFCYIIGVDYSHSQSVCATIMDAHVNSLISFVNIGILNKNLGTVTDELGRFCLDFEPNSMHDSVSISMIGYHSIHVSVPNFIDLNNSIIKLSPRIYDINEVIIKPKNYGEKILGITSNTNKILAGFKDNKLGYECGIIMKSKKSAYIKEVNFNISLCTYDSILYRLNIYEINDKEEFINILREPIYIHFSNAQIKDKITINLRDKNIIANGNFLVSLEHIKDIGPGELYFSTTLFHKTYFRETSQGKWDKIPAGISISVLADVEK